MKVRLMLHALVLMVVASSVFAGEAKKATATLDERIKPGNKFVVEFPDRIKALDKGASRFQVYIPTDYTPDRKFPLHLWLGGGTGGCSARNCVVGKEGWICIGMPLFHAPPEIRKKGSGFKHKLHLWQIDDATIWKEHKFLLDEIQKLIPNIHPYYRVAGGFSNGAHCIGFLINTTPEFSDFFNCYYFFDGGYTLRNVKALAGRPLHILYGETSVTRNSLPGIHNYALGKGVLSTLTMMKNTGHKANPEYNPQVKAWIDEVFIKGSLPGRMKAAKSLSKSKDTAKAISVLSSLLYDTKGSKYEEKAKANFAALNARAEKDFERIVKSELKDAKGKFARIKKLADFESKFKGLDVSNKAAELIATLKAEDGVGELWSAFEEKAKADFEKALKAKLKNDKARLSLIKKLKSLVKRYPGVSVVEDIASKIDELEAINIG